MKIFKRITAAAFALSMMLALTGCGKDNDEAAPTGSETVADEEFAETYYTGKAVENPEDLAIYKFNVELPEGFKAVIENEEGKQYATENCMVIVKAQNYKEEFQELAVFADQGCAGIKISNMLYQADTEFSEPMDTSVAGFDAIRYDYTVTAYIFPPVTDAAGEYVLDDAGQPVLSEEKELYGEYVNRVYYFYSDEDAFYVICEAPKERSEAAQAEFDAFMENISISPKK